MPMIHMNDARRILRDAGVPENVIMAVTLAHIVSEDVVNYTLVLWAHAMREEQIAIIVRNSMTIANILNVRRFFRELGPLALRFGFSPMQVQHDIVKFDYDMEKYSHELIDTRKIKDICQNPAMMVGGVDALLNICGVGKDKYYRAAIEFVERCKIANRSNEYVLAVLNRCITKNGVDMTRLLRLTTGRPNYTGNSIISHTDGDTIKPKVRLRNMQYVNATYRFFAENSDKIRGIATKYSGVDFISAFYDLCTNWTGWNWHCIPHGIEFPNYKTTLRDGIEIVIKAITFELSHDIQTMISNIATHEFVKIVPDATYEAPWQKFLRMVRLGR